MFYEKWYKKLQDDIVYLLFNLFMDLSPFFYQGNYSCDIVKRLIRHCPGEKPVEFYRHSEKNNEPRDSSDQLNSDFSNNPLFKSLEGGIFDFINSIEDKFSKMPNYHKDDSRDDFIQRIRPFNNFEIKRPENDLPPHIKAKIAKENRKIEGPGEKM
jgi:hypothetical protein